MPPASKKRRPRKKKTAEEALAPILMPGTAPEKNPTMPVKAALVPSTGHLTTPAKRRNLSPIRFEQIRMRFLHLISEGKFNDPAYDRNPWEFIREELACTVSDITLLIADPVVHTAITNAWVMELGMSASAATRKLRQVMNHKDASLDTQVSAARELLGGSTRAVQAMARLASSAETAAYQEAQSRDLRALASEMRGFVESMKKKEEAQS